MTQWLTRLDTIWDLFSFQVQEEKEVKRNTSPLSAPLLVSASVTFSLSERCLRRLRISSAPGRCWGWWKLRFCQHPRCAGQRAQRWGHKRWINTEKMKFPPHQNIAFGFILRRFVVQTYLQWTEMGPSWPNCSFVLCTWPMKSMKPSPDFGTPCSGQSVNWNCLTVRDCPSWQHRDGNRVMKWNEQVIPRLFFADGQAVAAHSITISIIIIHPFCGLYSPRQLTCYKKKKQKKKIRHTSSFKTLCPVIKVASHFTWLY